MSLTLCVFADKASTEEAEKLLDTMNMEVTLEDSIEQMLEVHAKPNIDPFKGVTLELFS